MKKIVIVGAGTAGLSAAAMMKSYWGDKVDITLIYDKSRGNICLLYTSPSPRDTDKSRMPSSA